MAGRQTHDSFGEMEVPSGALWGASTQRVINKLGVSPLRLPTIFIASLGTIKAAAARANVSLGILDRVRGEAIERAAQEVADGVLNDQFVVDLFQTGSGTATNMNANEVIATKAMVIIKEKGGTEVQIHPNDHVNMGQSSNDVFPSAVHISAYRLCQQQLLPALKELQRVLEIKSSTFADVIKAGRTHLQDATSITLGQEFSGYATQIRRNIERIERGSLGLLRLALGGTAVGTGLNTHPLFAEFAIREIVAKTGFPFVETENHFEAQASMDVAVEMSGQLKTLAISMMKIANDLRLLSSGPRCGFGEISLPAFAPGSSIMPGKVNPVVCEMVLMVSAQVIGNDSTITVCGQHGNLELHTMMPVLAYNLLQSIELLASISRLFAESCISGIEADRERCLAYAESSLSVVTALAPTIGYEKAATVAREAMRQGRSIKEVARDLRVLPTDEVGRLCDVRRMTGAGASLVQGNSRSH